MVSDQMKPLSMHILVMDQSSDRADDWPFILLLLINRLDKIKLLIVQTMQT